MCLWRAVSPAETNKPFQFSSRPSALDHSRRGANFFAGVNFLLTGVLRTAPMPFVTFIQVTLGIAPST
jgi:hypothetical protein